VEPTPRLDAVDQMGAQWRRERPDLDPSSMIVFARLSRAHLAAAAAIDATLAPFGIKRGEFDVLASLRRAGAPFELNAGRLAQAMVLSPAATTHRLDRLQSRGLLTRRPHPANGRVILVQLSDAGLQLVEEAVVAHTRTLDRLLAPLPPADRDRLTALLAALDPGTPSMGTPGP
jgi:DNA-binding MarR family transcriptional regulator